MNFDDAVTTVLQDRKYDVLMERKFDLMQRMKEWFLRALENILSNIHISPPSSTAYYVEIFFYIFFAIAIFLLLFIIGWIWKSLSKRKASPKTIAEIIQDLEEQKLTYEDLLRFSDEQAVCAHLREAVRYRYIAALWTLNACQLIHLNPFKTNSQFQKELQRNAPHLSNRFQQIVVIFQSLWFGHKKITSEQFETFKNHFNLLTKEARQLEK